MVEGVPGPTRIVVATGIDKSPERERAHAHYVTTRALEGVTRRQTLSRTGIVVRTVTFFAKRQLRVGQLVDDVVAAVKWRPELQAQARQRRQGLALRVSLSNESKMDLLPRCYFSYLCYLSRLIRPLKRTCCEEGARAAGDSLSPPPTFLVGFAARQNEETGDMLFLWGKKKEKERVEGEKAQENEGKSGGKVYSNELVSQSFLVETFFPPSVFLSSAFPLLLFLPYFFFPPSSSLSVQQQNHQSSRFGRPLAC